MTENKTDGQKAERKMTEKGFLHKCTTKAAASAGAFIEAHRQFLKTGSLATVTEPILAKIDSKELMPTPGLQEIRDVVFAHMMAKEIERAEESLERTNEPRIPKNWCAAIYDKNGSPLTKLKGEKEIELVEEFDHPQDADRWVDRRLVDGEPGCFGVVHHTTLVGKNGDLISSTILRGDAFARVFQKKRQPVLDKPKSTGGGGLGFRPKAQQSTAKFSHG